MDLGISLVSFISYITLKSSCNFVTNRVWITIIVYFGFGCPINPSDTRTINILITAYYINGIYGLIRRPTKNLSRWRHQMETFSALLTLCAGNSPVSGEYPVQSPVTRGFDVFFDLHLNKRLSKQSWGWWFETLSSPFWRHCNVMNRLLKGFSDSLS